MSRRRIIIELLHGMRRGRLATLRVACCVVYTAALLHCVMQGKQFHSGRMCDSYGLDVPRGLAPQYSEWASKVKPARPPGRPAVVSVGRADQPVSFRVSADLRFGYSSLVRLHVPLDALRQSFVFALCCFHFRRSRRP